MNLAHLNHHQAGTPTLDHVAAATAPVSGDAGRPLPRLLASLRRRTRRARLQRELERLGPLLRVDVGLLAAPYVPDRMALRRELRWWGSGSL